MSDGEKQLNDDDGYLLFFFLFVEEEEGILGDSKTLLLARGMINLRWSGGVYGKK